MFKLRSIERSVQIKIFCKIHATRRQKRNFDGLYEVSAPGSTVGKLSPTTSVIKEPNKPEVRVRYSDIAKFGTKHKRETDFAEYPERIPPKFHDKTLEQKIQNHKKNLLQTNLDRKKISFQENKIVYLDS